LRFIDALSDGEYARLMSLDTPRRIQAHLDAAVKVNFEPDGDTCRGPLAVIRSNEAHCIEAAMLAAIIMRMHGKEAFLVDLTANEKDDDHVLAVFTENGHWGAMAKSNHHCLSYRDPVYTTLRELVMSYFHEYLNRAGEKTLRSFSTPLDLRRFDERGWLVAEKNVWYVPLALIKLPHEKLLLPGMAQRLTKADDFTRDVNNLERQRPPRPPKKRPAER
jgi:hypothetical protein